MIVDDEIIAREIIESHLSQISNITIEGSCSNAMEAFNIISTKTIDLIFLDINMPGISGIAFAKSINSNIKIIFTTAYRDYAVEGFELRAVDYLLKPISFERLEKAVKNYFEVYTNQPVIESNDKENSDFIFIRSERKMIKLDFDQILFIESYSDYLKIHTKDKLIVTRETISALEAKLPGLEFLRIHRSFIVSIKSISSFTHELITIGKHTLPISRSYKKQVLDLLQKF
ncbi:MAG: response regulator transcription factor [Psychroserpens sp.]|nr:response regulator transcription factor [Psychroserpens sp.]